MIKVIAAAYYLGVVWLIGLSVDLTSMAEFFGHALIYMAAVGLISSMFFVADRSSSAKREAELCHDAAEKKPH